jgi:protein-disulfide isomerase
VSRPSSLVLFVAAAALSAAPIARADTGADEEVGFDASATYRVPIAGAPARGPADALVTIVEFSDFRCQFCRLAGETLAEVQRLYPREVRVVYRHSLLDPEGGTLAAEAAEAAAAQGRFWPFHDRLFAAEGRIDRAEVERAAREVGLDMPRFLRDLDGARYRSTVRESDRQASRLGVSATPAFFVNGRPLAGARPLGAFLALVEAERAEAQALVARGVGRAGVYEQVTARGLAAAGRIALGADEVRDAALDPRSTYSVELGQPAQRHGRADALVTVIEFGDYRCGYCVHMQPILDELARQYGDDLRIVYRHMPLGGNPVSRRLAEAADAAGEQGRFWPMHARLFASDGPLDRGELEAIAADIGLDVARFRAALDRRRFALDVSRDAADAARLGVRGTPTFFVNGMVIPGAPTAELFRAVIDQKLAEARALVQRGVRRADVYRVATGKAP